MTGIKIATSPIRRLFVLALTLTAVMRSALCGQYDWPQWQGPERNAHSKETGLLKEWPKEGPPLAWKVKGLGGGDSMPSVAGGRIYGMSNRGGDECGWGVGGKEGEGNWGGGGRPGGAPNTARIE